MKNILTSISILCEEQIAALLLSLNKFYVSAGIFAVVGVSLLLMVPAGQWGFINDDFGFLYQGRTALFHAEWGNFFPTIETLLDPDNFSCRAKNFFSVLWRPLVTLLNAVFYFLFKDNSYASYAWGVCLHALWCVLVSAYFSLLSVSPLVFISGLCFAIFHPSISFWIGSLSCHQYAYTGVVLLLSALFFEKWCIHNKNSYLCLSVLFFGCALLVRESSLFFPCSLWCLKKAGIGKRENSLQKTYIPFFLLAFAYLLFRFLLFPLSFEGAPSVLPSVTFNISFLKEKLFDGASMLLQLLGAGYISYSSCFFKVIFLAIWAVLIFKAGYTGKKKTLFWSAGAASLLLWPNFLLGYQPRYLYEALPIISLFVGNVVTADSLKNIGLLFVAAQLPFSGFFFHDALCYRNERYQLVIKSMQQIEKKAFVDVLKIRCVALPQELFPPSGIAQALKFYTNKEDLIVTYDVQENYYVSKKIDDLFYPLPVGYPVCVHNKENEINVSIYFPHAYQEDKKDKGFPLICRALVEEKEKALIWDAGLGKLKIY